MEKFFNRTTKPFLTWIEEKNLTQRGGVRKVSLDSLKEKKRWDFFFWAEQKVLRGTQIRRGNVKQGK